MLLAVVEFACVALAIRKEVDALPVKEIVDPLTNVTNGQKILLHISVRVDVPANALLQFLVIQFAGVLGTISIPFLLDGCQGVSRRVVEKLSLELRDDLITSSISTLLSLSHKFRSMQITIGTH
jgi:hypothetical protein